MKTKHNDRLKQTIAIPWSTGRIEIPAHFKPGSAPVIYGLPVHLRTLRNLKHIGNLETEPVLVIPGYFPQL